MKRIFIFLINCFFKGQCNIIYSHFLFYCRDFFFHWKRKQPLPSNLKARRLGPPAVNYDTPNLRPSAGALLHQTNGRQLRLYGKCYLLNWNSFSWQKSPMKGSTRSACPFSQPLFLSIISAWLGPLADQFPRPKTTNEFPSPLLSYGDQTLTIGGVVFQHSECFDQAWCAHRRSSGREHFILRDGYVIGWWDCALCLLYGHLILHLRHYMFSSVHIVRLTCSKREDHLSLEPTFIKASRFTPFPWMQSWKESPIHVPIPGIFYLSRQHEIKVSHAG